MLPLESGPARTQGLPHVFLRPSPERDREIDQLCDLIRNMAQAGIPAGRYNITILGHLRTESRTGRGGENMQICKYANMQICILASSTTFLGEWSLSLKSTRLDLPATRKTPASVIGLTEVLPESWAPLMA